MDNFLLQHNIALADQLIQETQDVILQIRDPMIQIQEQYQSKLTSVHKFAKFEEVIWFYFMWLHITTRW